MDSSTILEPKYASPSSANPLSVQRIAVRPRQPKRQRPNSSTANTIHARHDSTVLCNEVLRKQVLDEDEAAEQRERQHRKAGAERLKGAASSASTDGRIVSQPSGWRLRKRRSSNAQRDRQRGGDRQQRVSQRRQTMCAASSQLCSLDRETARRLRRGGRDDARDDHEHRSRCLRSAAAATQAIKAIRPIGQPISEAVSAIVKASSGRAKDAPEQRPRAATTAMRPECQTRDAAAARGVLVRRDTR